MIRPRRRKAREHRRRGRGRKLIIRALAVTVISGAALAAAGAPAFAATSTPAAGAIHIPNPFSIFGSCKTPPTPQPPGQGMSGWAEIKPAPPPAPAAAFGAHPASTEYVQYGYAGLVWSTYDQGCVDTNFGTMIDTSFGDLFMGGAKVIVAVDNTVHTWASGPSWMNALTPLVTGANGALYKALFVTWAAVALMIVGLSVILRAHRSDMPSALTLSAWALLIIGLVSGVVAAPAWAGQQASALMGSTLNALDAGFVGPGGQANAAQAHDSLTVSSVLYPAWLRGEFGDPASPIAQQYGPQLFQAQALTWSQAAASPQQIAATDKAEEAKWGHIASQVQSASPQAYAAIQGNANSRIGAGVLALLTAAIVCGFDLIASLVVIVALLGVLAGVIMLPALGVVGMHHGMRHLITGLGSRILGMLINGVLYAAAAGVDQLATKTLLTQSILPQPLALLLLAVLPFALWMLLRKLRGRDAIPRVAKRAALLGLGYATMRRGARRGAEDALAQHGPAGPSDMYWTDPWTWRADAYTVPPVILPPPPPPARPVNGGGPGGGGPLPPGGGPGGWPAALPPSPRPLPPPPRPSSPPPGPGGNGSGPPPSGPGPSGNGSGPGPGPAGGGAAAPPPPPPPPPAPAPASGPREYTGTPRQPGAEPEVLTPTRIFGPGETADPAATYDGGSLYDGGAAANTRIPPPWERAATSAPQGPAADGTPRRPAGTWQHVAGSPPQEPADGKARVWIEDGATGVYVVVEKADGMSRTKVADGEQAEIAARQARNWSWR